MSPFSYLRASTVAEAIALNPGHRSDRRREPRTDVLAGGTDMVQLMREHLREPDLIVDITGIAQCEGIEETAAGLRLGALVRMSDAAQHPAVLDRYTVVAEALLESASAQVRNLATLGGNVLQRTRCGYFRDAGAPCNKREPGSGCPAIAGQNRLHAIFGVSTNCIATYAGDLANALLVLDARVGITGKGGRRSVPIAELHRKPADTPWVETQLVPGDLITHFDLPARSPSWRSHYLKVRDRTSFEWALASAAIALDIDGRNVRDARIAVGGVATTPWRLPHVEALLRGRSLTAQLALDAGAMAAAGAVTREHNRYKLDLIKHTVTRAIEEMGALA